MNASSFGKNVTCHNGRGLLVLDGPFSETADWDTLPETNSSHLKMDG